MKMWMALAVLSAALIPAVEAKEFDSAPIAQDVNIMKGILGTALAGERERGSWFDDNAVDAWYLARQGVVFRVNARHYREMSPFNHHFEVNTEFLEHISEMAQGIAESVADVDYELPEPPELPEVPQVSVSVGGGERMGEAERENLRKMSGDMREKARAVREIAREMRQLERDNDGGKQTKALAAKREELNKARAELKSLREQQRKLLGELRSKQEARWNEQLLELETKAVTALCNYGGSLKSVPKDENVTLMLSGALKEEGERKDRIYVFSRKDLNDCQNEKISAAQLKERAVGYSF